MNKRREEASVNTGSMADIAFLLLIFFLVTTTIASDKGIAMMLPPDQEQPPLERNKRNVLNLLINSEGSLLADEELLSWEEVSDLAKNFIANPQQLDHFAESPQEAIISIKSDRGTDYKDYIRVLDEVKRSYYELRATHLGIDVEAYQALDRHEAADKEKLDEAKKAFPMQISEAEPSKTVQ